MTNENAAEDLINMAETCNNLMENAQSDEIYSAADDALRSLIKSMAILGYNLVSGDGHDSDRR